MRKIFSVIIYSIIFISCGRTSKSGIEINGSVKNFEYEYISLNYDSRLRGNLNFDNFKTIAAYIDSIGNFNLNSDKITDAANYTLEFKDKLIRLPLFNKDAINLHFDVNNPVVSVFATGSGAGKINILNLTQFEYENFDIETNSLRKFNNHMLNIITGQRKILDAIYSKKADEKIISNTQNKGEIQKIIKNSPLTEREYDFLINRIDFQKYSLITNFLSKLSSNKSLNTVEIDFNSDAFKHFNSQEYKKLNSINDWHFANSLESILQIEYLRHLKKQKEIKVTYGNWNSFLNDSNFYDWVSTFLRTNFNQNIYCKYFADLSAWLMTLGYDYKSFYEKIDSLDLTDKHILRLNTFKELLETGLYNKDYELNKNNLELNKNNFNSLLEHHNNKPLLIVFWSAQYSGASIIKNLGVIKLFEEINDEKINLINVCIDKKANKNLWAARIIDNTWKSEHYFLPIEGNDSILNKFSNKNISAFCDGGATYAYVDQNGKINNSIEFPFHKSIEEIQKSIKKNPHIDKEISPY